MAIHPIWVPCRCGCGCGHRCSRRYGPYFVDSSHDSSEYIGDIDKAADYLAAGDKKAKIDMKAILMDKALSSAHKQLFNGREILPPSERAPHIAEIHGKKVSRTRKTKISPGTQEFWDLFKKTRAKSQEPS